MSYVEHTWGPGNEAITNEKLNNIESGISEALQSGGGISYDAVIKGNEYISNTTLELVSGDFSAIYTKLENLEPVHVLYYEEYSSGYGVIMGVVSRVCISEGDIGLEVIDRGGTTHYGWMFWDGENAPFWD